MRPLRRLIGERRPDLLWPALGVMLAVHLLGVALTTARTWFLGIAAQRLANDLPDFRGHAAELVAQGLTTPEEAYRVLATSG
jgi:type II secretory ATPase GspE/PulE/Tfp pilus assembly ATPase PilB-like protein